MADDYTMKPKGKWKRRLLPLLFICILAVLLFAAKGIFWGESSPEPLEGLRVTYFECSEDADSILLQTTDVTVLIDTGLEEDSMSMVRRMRELGVSHIDLLVLTHPDKDHIGGVKAVTEAFPIRKIYENSYEKGSQLEDTSDQILEKLEAEVLENRETMTMGSGENALLLDLYPAENKTMEQSNDSSIAVQAKYQGKQFFFAGDAEEERNEELLQLDLPPMDVLKVPYHGRKTDNVDALIEKLHPKVAVVTAASPKKKVRKALEAVGAQIFCTGSREVRITVIGGALAVY